MSLSACQSAAAMAAQLLSGRSELELYQAWNRGVSELYLEIARFGKFSASFSKQFEQNASGIYSYDVDEEFGNYLADQILNETYDIRIAKAKLRELIIDFYTSDPSPA